MGDVPPLSTKVKIGDTVTFGNYEQDNNLDNGQESIEWEVLDIQDGKAFLLSKYALDCQPYNEERTDVTWETCTLRAWLNGEFFNMAFDPYEAMLIAETNVVNADNAKYGTEGGSDTVDKVFLLCLDDMEEYYDVGPDKWFGGGNYGPKESLACRLTDYGVRRFKEQYVNLCVLSYPISAEGANPLPPKGRCRKAAHLLDGQQTHDVRFLCPDSDKNSMNSATWAYTLTSSTPETFQWVDIISTIIRVDSKYGTYICTAAAKKAKIRFSFLFPGIRKYFMLPEDSVSIQNFLVSIAALQRENGSVPLFLLIRQYFHLYNIILKNSDFSEYPESGIRHRDDTRSGLCDPLCRSVLFCVIIPREEDKSDGE